MYGLPPRKARNYRNGGPISGPGTGISDDIPATVPEGSFIMPADSTQQIGLGLNPEVIRRYRERQAAAAEPTRLGFGPGSELEKRMAARQAESSPGQGLRPRDVPVNLSNGEHALSPEQVHAVGAQVLNAVKGITHVPAEMQARGLRAPEAAGTSDAEPLRIGFANGGAVPPARTGFGLNAEVMRKVATPPEPTRFGLNKERWRDLQSSRPGMGLGIGPGSVGERMKAAPQSFADGGLAEDDERRRQSGLGGSPTGTTYGQVTSRPAQPPAPSTIAGSTSASAASTANSPAATATPGTYGVAGLQAQQAQRQPSNGSPGALTTLNRGDPVRDAANAIGGFFSRSAAAARTADPYGFGGTREVAQATPMADTSRPASFQRPGGFGLSPTSSVPSQTSESARAGFGLNAEAMRGLAAPPEPTRFGLNPERARQFSRDAFGPDIQNQGQTSADRLAAQGYSAREVPGAPGVSRLTGSDGRTIYTNDQANTADWIQGGMRPGVSTISGPSAQELSDRADRMRAIREQNTALRDELNFNRGGALSRQASQDEITRGLLTGPSRSGRQVAAQLIAGQQRAGVDQQQADLARQRLDLEQQRIGADARLQGLQADRFAREDSLLDQLQNAESPEERARLFGQLQALRGTAESRREPFQVATAEELIDPRDPNLGTRRVPYVIDPQTGQGRPVVQGGGSAPAITLDRVRETAKARGMTEAQVIEILRQNGHQVG